MHERRRRCDIGIMMSPFHSVCEKGHMGGRADGSVKASSQF